MTRQAAVPDQEPPANGSSQVSSRPHSRVRLRREMPEEGYSAGMDITEIILTQHDEQRRGFAALDDVDRGDVDTLTALWSRLEVLLEVHADAEERFFYPRLLELGTGIGAANGPKDEVTDAISDHNEIREGIRKARAAAPGSDQWWDAVRECREANSEHMAEEERDDLADFRRNADLQLRHDIAAQFLAYEGRHPQGVEPVDTDPERYVTSGG